ncbi:thiamine diphosphokinase [Streptococcus sp. CSL10205-OR2]|uniref:thiamine diphosphokinase n=1 Tax=Streptococcus sp. CSL10205-OR2 TaxID=2980558 RepID=UPI0021D87369|nr:thiamine diphosphokinase [Streptococcus sp. CSL10205-OR2]MCU9533114.1 thiamine diphosphokinase [Streptococcus sp. CSL10205-OR2]
MINIALFTGGVLDTWQGNFDFYVGVDRGSLFLLEQNLPLTMAIGDFDSVSETEFERIKKQAQKLYLAKPEKNDTDTEMALKIIFKTYPKAHVTVFGALGGRIDHEMSNLFLPSDPDLYPLMTQITLCDAQNNIRFYPKGEHLVEKNPNMTYVSFMTNDDSELTITGAKYELTKQTFFKKQIYTSNEFINQPITIDVSSGYAIVIQSKDRS